MSLQTRPQETTPELFGAKTTSRADFLHKIRFTPLKDAQEVWLAQLKPVTSRNYSYYLRDLNRRGIIPTSHPSGSPFTVDDFNEVVHEAMIDHIKQVEEWGEGTRQVKAACYIGFTAFLNRISSGWFRKAIPSTLESNKTFFQIREKCATNPVSLLDWHKFVVALERINLRDSLIAKTMLQGAKRIGEVLEITLNQVDFEKNIITFRQSKSRGLFKEIPITYSDGFMQELKDYIEATSHIRKEGRTVFITRNGKPVFRTRLNQSFEKACADAGVGRIHPHKLRATWVTEAKRRGIADEDVQRVTGHTTSKMVQAYDKTSSEDNASKKMILV